MRSKLSSRPFIVILFVYTACIGYFNRQRILKIDVEPTNTTEILVETVRYGREFCVGFNVTKGKRSFRENGLEPVTLAVHTTSNYLNYVLEQTENWDGPISVALIVDRQSQKAVNFLYSVFLCDPVFAEKISLHVVFRLMPFTEECPTLTLSPSSCEFIHQYTERFITSLISPFSIYPINTMRNVARKGAPTHFHLLADVEMIFSESFAKQANKLANANISKDGKKLIVLRRFELESAVKRVPRTVKDLKAHIDNKTVFEFHQEFFPAGHTIPGLWHWFTVSNASAQPFVWEIPYKGPEWEPQLIMHSSTPFNEEDIPTRWRDQQVLTYELCRANYTFLLASHIFNVHRGVKRKVSILDKAIQNHQAQLKDRYLKRYLKRINEVYPNSTAPKCGKFTL